MKFSISLLPLLLPGKTLAFAPTTFVNIQNVGSISDSSSALHASVESRRGFISTTVAAAMGSMTLISPSFADETTFDDLAMPSEEETKKQEEEAMAARLKRKAELQKAAAQPIKYNDSMKSEKEKQKSMKKSRDEMRNALCEELGRGC